MGTTKTETMTAWYPKWVPQKTEMTGWYPKWVPSWFFLPLWYPFWVPQNHVFQWQDTHFVVQIYKMHLLGSSLIPLLTFHASMII